MAELIVMSRISNSIRGFPLQQHADVAALQFACSFSSNAMEFSCPSRSPVLEGIS